MAEQYTAEAPGVVVEQHLRKYALAGIASRLLEQYGEAADQSRSFVWTNGDRTFCLNRDDNDTWLYTLDGDGEHDAYDAAEIAERQELREALMSEARRRMLETAKGRFAERGVPSISVHHDGHYVAFEDFTAAEHGPFVWIKVGPRAEYAAYDLSAEELRRATSYSRAWPVPPMAPQETLIEWMMGALAEETLDQSRAMRITQTREYQVPLQRSERSRGPEDITEFMARDFGHLMDEMETWSHDALFMRTRDNVTTIRTVLNMTTYDYTTHAGRDIRTAVGLVYDKKSLFMEVFDVASEGRSRKVIKVDIAGHRAFGSGMSDGGHSEGYKGDVAADQVYNILTLLTDGYDDDDGIEQCTPEIAAHFQYRLLRPDQQDSVQ